MSCPRCGTEYVCPCKHCRERESEKTPWISHDDDTESCPKCGLRKHVDMWLEEELKQFYAQKGGE